MVVDREDSMFGDVAERLSSGFAGRPIPGYLCASCSGP